MIEGDVVEAVRALKDAAGGGELQVHGSAGLIQDLFRAGLVDELRVVTFPVTVGSGKRLFEAGAPATSFELVSVTGTPSGVDGRDLPAERADRARRVRRRGRQGGRRRGGAPPAG